MCVQVVIRILAIGGLCLTLAACDSAEERAEAYFESAQELIASGDQDRAIIELRNVFELMPNHIEARRSMARLMVEGDNLAGAYGQYLRLVEQLPDDVEGLSTLAELAFEGRNWEDFTRHGQKAVELAPEAERSKVIELALLYRAAVLEDDTPAAEAVATRAETMAEEVPQSELLDQIMLDNHLRTGASEKALAQIDRMIARTPDARNLYDQRLMLLRETASQEDIETHLRMVVATFPDENNAKSMLVRYLIVTGKDDAAEAFLREISDPADADPAFFISLVQFLREVRGNDVAQAELEAALDVSPEPDRLRMILAALDFEDGQQEKAITNLREIIDRAEPSATTNEIKVALSRMLQITGNQVGAQRLVGEVLEADGDNVEALKISAARQIEVDDTDSAIANLRRALDFKPEDEQALNLMADAYLRAGSRDLAREFMAQAVDASGHAPESSLRYARLLIADDNTRSAEEVLIAALRRLPIHEEILAVLGDLYLATEDIGRAEAVIAQLRQIGSASATSTANSMQVQVLARQKGSDEALAFLEEMSRSAEAGIDEQVALVRARMELGQSDMALGLAEELVAEAPGDADRRFLLAMTRAATGDLAAAQVDMRALLTEDPTRAPIWQQLYRMVQSTKGPEAASAVLDEALAAVPDAPTLLWARAIELEGTGEIDAAIAIYEGLYQRNTNSVVLANNLASLLVTYKEDSASLDRAWAIARRLRDTDVPAFQDTYGWLAFRRGEAETALPYLKNAAAGLPEDPIVQYHLAEAYVALDRSEDAIAAYERALILTQADDPRPQIEWAREKLMQLQETDSETDN